MSEIVIISDEPEADEPEVTTDDVVDLVDDAIDHVVEAITDEEHHDDNVALLVGTLVAGLEALTHRIEAVEGHVLQAQVTADVALDAVAEVADAALTEEEEAEIIDEPIIVVEDEPPATVRSRFNKFWFGQ